MKHGWIYFVIFTISGFSGLIYESIWTHYLKLFLGHAAYAQTLVLAIFMGGMAIGSWLCSRFSGRWSNLLAGYAAAEGIIGLCALIFHELFTLTVDVSYTSVIPQLGLPLTVTAYKWAISVLLILPPSILLGMTFPLMTAGFIRLFPERPGRSIALLYCVNSLGATAGVLASGFILIRVAGLPGTIRTAGIINVILALTVWLLARNMRLGSEGGTAETAAAGSAQDVGRYRLFLVAALVTGAASFLYEIGWIRMLSLVLGTSTHAFELMLSAFIFGLAAGGLWIRRRIDLLAAPVRFLALVQVIMGLLALSSLLLYGNTFEVMQWLIANLERTGTGYALFNLSSSALAMAIMLPTTFCAGMTLPLITSVLFREGAGEQSIGAVYAANTVGAIVGVFFAIHVGMPLLGLKGVITLGAGLDIALGLVLLWSAPAGCRSRLLPGAVTVAGIGAVAATMAFVQLDYYKMGSGVYRYGVLLPRNGFRHLFHRDGKTATVDVFLDGMGAMRINTNGKTDATIMMDPGRAAGMDEATQILLAAIPMALHPQGGTVAAIGLGSGLTTHTLLLNPLITRVDTVEIEAGMVAAAQNFRPNVERAYTDPRSRIYLDDAKTFFTTFQKKYDIIISEPSNPWVSGVSGLFSEEFYRLIRSHLNDDGLFVQWVQLYEINIDLVMSVLKAISANFPDFAIYAPDDLDILIVAPKNGPIPAPDATLLKHPALATTLNRISITGIQDISLRKLGDRKTFGHLITSYPVRANSDYFPLLDQNAARTRFLNESAQELLSFARLPLPVAELLSGAVPPQEPTDITSTAAFTITQGAATAMALRDYFLSGHFDQTDGAMSGNDRNDALRVKRMFFECGAVSNSNERFGSLFATAENMIPFLTPSELRQIWQVLESGPCASALSPVERECLALFKAISRRDSSGMVEAATQLLGRGMAISPSTLRYLTAAGMTGYLMQGRKGDAYGLWSRHGAALLFGNQGPDLLFRLLVAESVPH